MHDDVGVAGHQNGGPPTTGRIVLRSEFAIVGVEISSRGGRQRLRLEDLRTQVSVELDPLELESLAWAQHADLAALLDPGRTRWRSERDESADLLADSTRARG